MDKQLNGSIERVIYSINKAASDPTDDNIRYIKILLKVPFLSKRLISSYSSYSYERDVLRNEYEDEYKNYIKQFDDLITRRREDEQSKK